MDSRLNEDQSEFAILVSSMLLDMLSNVNSLLDQVVKVLRQRRGNSVHLEDSEDLRSSDSLNLRDTVLISQQDTDLRWSRSSLGQLNHLISQILSRDMNPAWWSFSVWKTSTGNTLSLTMHSTHCFSIN